MLWTAGLKRWQFGFVCWEGMGGDVARRARRPGVFFSPNCVLTRHGPRTSEFDNIKHARAIVPANCF